MIAHVGGLPVEEILAALMSGAGAGLILRLTSLGARTRPRSTNRQRDLTAYGRQER